MCGSASTPCQCPALFRWALAGAGDIPQLPAETAGNVALGWGKKQRGENRTTFTARALLNGHNGYQDWGIGSQELEQTAQTPWGKTQRYPRAPQLWHVNLGVPGSLWPRKREWQQHICAVPAPALSAWSPPCLLWTEGAVGGEQRILINGLHHTLFSLKIPPWDREGQNTHLS